MLSVGRGEAVMDRLRKELEHGHWHMVWLMSDGKDEVAEDRMWDTLVELVFEGEP